MSLKVLIKRIAPFLATFAIGLFVAGFFVTITAPRFQWKRSHREYDRQLEIQNQSLREENSRLKSMQNNVSDDVDYQNLKYAVPALPPVAPKAPLAPKHIN